MAQAVRSDGAPAPIGPYSQAIAAGDELFCSGQIALDPQTGDLLIGDAAAQAERALQNLGAVLEAAGMTYANVVKTTLYLVDMDDFAAVNEVYARFFEAAKPARSTVAVAGLPKGARVEVDAIARR
ncbi:MAG TPA: RidA family protein [Candidatus Baltobacteraceae bacterium]|jgi:2-iminobutanoate/2-iminopropanoate deaminase|nr:RidA family protein [Candidatus Baltobacteraceae bacterium]